MPENKEIIGKVLEIVGDVISLVQAQQSGASEEEMLEEATELALDGLQAAGLFIDAPDKIDALGDELPQVIKSAYAIFKIFADEAEVPGDMSPPDMPHPDINPIV